MELTTADYLAILRRRAAVVLAVLALTVMLVVALAAKSASTYKATAEVFVTPIIDPVSNTPSVAKRDTLVNLGTEQRLATSLAVAEAVRTELEIDDLSARELRNKVAAVQVPETELLRISYLDKDPDIAKQRASAWGQAYLDLRRSRAAASRAEITDQIEADIDTAVAELAELNARIADPDLGAAERFSADAQREAALNQLQILQDNLVKVKTASLDPGQVITEPQNANEQKSFGSKQMFILIIMGGFGAVALALLVERLDRRVRGEADLAGTGLTVLGVLPRTRADAVAANRLRNVVMHGEPAPRVVIVSGDDARGTAVVGSQLGRALAAAGVSTLLVSAMPESGELERLFGVPATDGLVEVVNGDLELERAVHAVDGAGPLAVMSAGAAGTWRPGLLARPSARRVIDAAVAQHDVVLIVTPSVLTATTALDLSGRADRTVMVVGHKDANADRIAQAAAELERVGVRPDGAVLVTRK